MKNLVEELEQRILNGETVTPLELAQAHLTADAAKRIAELTKQREVETANTHLVELAALKERAHALNISATERMSLGYQISDMEKNK
jgi:hypothetical protein